MQLTLAQLRSFGITPDTNLGQHFLVDDNVLRVIERMADLSINDVCYEPGIGVGILTNFLCRRVGFVHAVEMDRRLEPAINKMAQDLANLSVHWGDATTIDPSSLTPAPTKLVSNLPYHVAAPIVAESIQQAHEIQHYCVMVQREVADRFFAREGTKSYNALSVLIRSTCTRTATHKVSRQVFIPPPNVDSSLIAFKRDLNLISPERVPEFSRFLKDAFRHRRKTLANNLQSSKVATREQTTAALNKVELEATSRPEQVSPARFVEIYSQLLGEGMSD